MTRNSTIPMAPASRRCSMWQSGSATAVAPPRTSRSCGVPTRLGSSSAGTTSRVRCLECAWAIRRRIALVQRDRRRSTSERAVSQAAMRSRRASSGRGGVRHEPEDGGSAAVRFQLTILAPAAGRAEMGVFEETTRPLRCACRDPAARRANAGKIRHRATPASTLPPKSRAPCGKAVSDER